MEQTKDILRTEEAYKLLYELCRYAEEHIDVNNHFYIIKECLMKLDKIEVIASAKDTAPKHLTNEFLLNEIIDTIYNTKLDYDFEKE